MDQIYYLFWPEQFAKFEVLQIVPPEKLMKSDIFFDAILFICKECTKSSSLSPYTLPNTGRTPKTGDRLEAVSRAILLPAPNPKTPLSLGFSHSHKLCLSMLCVSLFLYAASCFSPIYMSDNTQHIPSLSSSNFWPILNLPLFWGETYACVLWLETATISVTCLH